MDETKRAVLDIVARSLIDVGGLDETFEPSAERFASTPSLTSSAAIVQRLEEKALADACEWAAGVLSRLHATDCCVRYLSRRLSAANRLHSRRLLQRAAKRLRGDEGEDDSLESSYSHSADEQVVASVSPVLSGRSIGDALTALVAPVPIVSGKLQHPYVLSRKGGNVAPPPPPVVGAGDGTDAAASVVVCGTPLGYPVTALRQPAGTGVVSAFRDLYRHGHVPALGSPVLDATNCALPTTTIDELSRGVAAEEHHRLAHVVDARFAVEHTTLALTYKLKMDLATSRRVLGDDCATVLSVQDGIVQLSLRGLCLAALTFSVREDRWVLVNFQWTIFEYDPTSTAVAQSTGRLLALFVEGVHEIQRKISADLADGGLPAFIHAILRVANGICLQHISNAAPHYLNKVVIARRMQPLESTTPARGDSPSLNEDRFAIISAQPISNRGECSISLMFRPIADGSVAVQDIHRKLRFNFRTAMMECSDHQGTRIDRAQLMANFLSTFLIHVEKSAVLSKMQTDTTGEVVVAASPPSDGERPVSWEIAAKELLAWHFAAGSATFIANLGANVRIPVVVLNIPQVFSVPDIL